MENASKALLIAAGVLIVILLIAFGMRIFNSTSGVADPLEDTMKSTEVAMFNNKFLKYVGEKKTINDAKAIINEIIVNNSTNSKKVEVDFVAQYTTATSVWNASTTDKLNKIIVELNKLNNNVRLYIYVTEGWYGGGSGSWKSGNDENGYVKYIYITNYINASDAGNV